MKKILLIEPNENHQSIFASLLRRKAYSVYNAKHFLVAKFNLINCSINQLPDMIIIGYGISFDGSVEIINFIRKKFYFANIKIFKLCPFRSNENGLKLVKAGADDFLCLTDFSPENFIYKISNLFCKINQLDHAIDTSLIQENEINTENKKQQLVDSKATKVNWNEIRKLINVQELERKLKKAAGAKAIPFVVTELLSLTSSINSDLKELIHFIELDPGLTARVLRCANSAYYRGNKGRIYNLMDAVKTMGFNGLKDLILSIGILDSFSKSSNVNGLNRMKLWYHSLTVAVIAREIAKLTKHNNPDYFFVSGMLHDLGTALFDDYFPVEYNQVLSLAREHEVPITTAESKMLGIDHCEIASNILKTWGFPENILHTMSKHHQTFSEILNSHDKQKQDVIIIKLADTITRFIGAGLFDYDEIEEIPHSILSFLNLDLQALNELLLKVTDSVNELIMVMLLHINPTELSNCNTFNAKKLYKAKKVLIFDNNPDNYCSYEMLFKKLNYAVTSNKSLFTLPECSNFDCMVLDFPDEKDIAQYVTILKKITNKTKDQTKLCVVTNETIFNSLVSHKELSNKIIYLLKPVSILKIFTVLDKFSDVNEQVAVNTR